MKTDISEKWIDIVIQSLCVYNSKLHRILRFRLSSRLGGLPWWLSSEESTCNAGDTARDLGLVPGSEKFPREENGNPLEYSCLENSMGRVWWATVSGVAKSRTRLSMHMLRTHTLKAINSYFSVCHVVKNIFLR